MHYISTYLVVNLLFARGGVEFKLAPILYENLAFFPQKSELVRLKACFIISGSTCHKWESISNANALWLERPFETDEIKKTIFESKKGSEGNKFSCTNLFSLKFFKSAWEWPQKDILSVFVTDRPRPVTTTR